MDEMRARFGLGGSAGSWAKGEVSLDESWVQRSLGPLGEGLEPATMILDNVTGHDTCNDGCWMVDSNTTCTSDDTRQRAGSLGLLFPSQQARAGRSLSVLTPYYNKCIPATSFHRRTKFKSLQLQQQQYARFLSV